jgi:hypothetical protein
MCTVQCTVHMDNFMFFYCALNVIGSRRKSDFPTSVQSGTGMEKMPMPEPVRYRNNETQSGTGMLRSPDLDDGCR